MATLPITKAATMAKGAGSSRSKKMPHLGFLIVVVASVGTLLLSMSRLRPYSNTNFASANVKTGGISSGRVTQYIVWMYPFPPPNLQEGDWEMATTTKDHHNILICPYKTACNGRGTSINLAELTKDTFYHSYVLDHTYHKLRHLTEFCHHIQVIAMICLLLKNEGVCVQTLGGDDWACSAKRFSTYNPYENGGLPWSVWTETLGESTLSLTTFPYHLLGKKKGGEVLSLAPDMSQEEFATYGPWKADEDLRLSGRYNSGEDIQSLAGIGWYPFISRMIEKANPYANYSGYYIANSLQSPLMEMPPLEDAEKWGSIMMEKLALV